MSRFTEPSIEQVLRHRPQRQLVFAELEFPSGWVRAHTGVGNEPTPGVMAWASWPKLKFKESAGKSPSGFEVSMLFDDLTLFSDIINEDPTGLTARLHLVGFR